MDASLRCYLDLHWQCKIPKGVFQHGKCRVVLQV